MPWNDNANPGPWGAPPPGDGDRKDSPSRRPQGGGGGGGRGPRGPGGPDFGAGFDQLGRRMRDMMGGPGGPRPAVIAAIVGGAFGLWALSGIYVVQPNEEAVITTFGAYTGNKGPGLSYHLPFPIQQVVKVPVTTLQQTNVGGATSGASPEESLMLTGDENIVDLSFTVAWRVADADRFVFTIRDPDASVKAAAESAMREIVGRTPLEEIISTGRGRAQQQALDLMQRTLDQWGAGVRVVEVQIRRADPPREVVDAFRDVQSAQQDRERAENEANAYRNRVVNEAKGDAARIIQAAEGYRQTAVAEAEGEAARFNQVVTEYRRAPGVTRDRLYIETMQRVLESSNKVVIDADGATAPIILPPDVFRPRAQPAPQAPAPTQQAPQPRSSQ
jgi:modulator of FtsH protease HflK